MNSMSKYFLGCLVLCCASTAAAQESAAEKIDLNVVIGQPVELKFPNDFDLIHDKVMTFEGSVENLDSKNSTKLQLRFDWFDPRGRVPEHKFSQPIYIDLGPGETRGVFESLTIPFCPPLVSLDLQLLGKGGDDGHHDDGNGGDDDKDDGDRGHDRQFQLLSLPSDHGDDNKDGDHHDGDDDHGDDNSGKAGSVHVVGVFTHTCVVPEPGTSALLASGLTGLLGLAHRRRRGSTARSV